MLCPPIDGFGSLAQFHPIKNPPKRVNHAALSSPEQPGRRGRKAAEESGKDPDYNNFMRDRSKL